MHEHDQIMCLESAMHRGVYISWNTGSNSVEFYVSCKCLCIICTMLLAQIKGLYHAITKLFPLAGSYTVLSWYY